MSTMNSNTNHSCSFNANEEEEDPNNATSSALLRRVVMKETTTPTSTSTSISSPTTVVAGLAGTETPPLLEINDTSSHSKNAWPLLPASRKSLRTTNPIRAIVDPVLAAAAAAARTNTTNNNNTNNGDTTTISLALGDPTAYLDPCPVAVAAVVEALQNSNSSCCAGYVNACGTDEARRAIAEHHHSSSGGEHVVVANGCSGALEFGSDGLVGWQ